MKIHRGTRGGSNAALVPYRPLCFWWVQLANSKTQWFPFSPQRYKQSVTTEIRGGGGDTRVSAALDRKGWWEQGSRLRGQLKCHRRTASETPPIKITGYTLAIPHFLVFPPGRESQRTMDRLGDARVWGERKNVTDKVILGLGRFKACLSLRRGP